MTLIPKPIRKETFEYFSPQTAEELRSDLNNVFRGKGQWADTVNLQGEFRSRFEFTIFPKRQYLYIKGYERKIAYLKGRIFIDDQGRTKVSFTVRPNFIFPAFFFFFPFLALMALNQEGKKHPPGLEWLFILVVPAIMLVAGHYAKKELKDTFVVFFELREEV